MAGPVARVLSAYLQVHHFDETPVLLAVAERDRKRSARSSDVAALRRFLAEDVFFAVHNPELYRAGYAKA